MLITIPGFIPKKVILVLCVITAIATPITGLVSRKLDESTVTGTPDPSMKCGSCPCNNPCAQSSPPPPPPALPPPPPPPPKMPPTQYCPPPPCPPSSYIYITGPPGNLYPIDTYFSGSSRIVAVGLPVLIGFGLAGPLAFL
ncbi:hypothetical protein NMG60_11018839 [Bertholletia excelsa]